MAVGEAPRAVDELGRVEPQPQLGTTIKGTAIKGGLRALEAGGLASLAAASTLI